MRRVVIVWAGAFAALLIAAAVAIAVVNSTVLSASGFVRVYLDSLARGDVAGALELPGVAPLGVDTSLLRDDMLDTFEDVELRSTEIDDDVHLVRYGWTVEGGSYESTFRVERAGSRFGVFPRWAFAESPTAVLSIRVVNDDRFRVNGVDTSTGVAATRPVERAVFVPGRYVIDHESRFLHSADFVVTASRPGSVTSGSLRVRANEAFVEQLDVELARFLDGCAAQGVLLPTGCPFGQQIQNRVVSEPVWSIEESPRAVVEPSGEYGVWRMLPASGVARLVVEVQSLFDGSVSTFDEWIPFQIGARISIIDDAGLVVEIRN